MRTSNMAMRMMEAMRLIGRVINAAGDKLIIPYSNIEGSRRKSFNTGVSVNNQASFTGGDDYGTFYMSIENQKIAGIVPNDKSQRTGVSVWLLPKNSIRSASGSLPTTHRLITTGPMLISTMM
jgi:hypothetical protein